MAANVEKALGRLKVAERLLRGMIADYYSEPKVPEFQDLSSLANKLNLVRMELTDGEAST